MKHEWRRDESYIMSTARRRLDFEAIHAFLSRAYWSRGIPIERMKRSIEHSLPFGVYCGPEQVGFARVITDYTTFAYLADVFIDESHRGKGLGKWLVETIVGHPELQGLRRFALMTRDAQELYRKFGFTPASEAPCGAGERPTWMQRWDPDVYRRLEAGHAATVEALAPAP